MSFPANSDLWTLFGSSFLAATLLPGGSEVVFALLASQEVYSPSVLIGVATLGNTLGGMVSLGMGWLVARRYPLRTLAQPSHQRAYRWLRRYGAVGLLGAWMPVIGDPLCFVAGWLRLNVFLGLFFMAVGKGARYAALWNVVG
ncbi:YqaA family protein [Nitrosococcus oceani]|uniref:YqaA family protein n=1 Tax=Nitrosococcus oceani TaxID=1229 RepID=UPI0004E90948|nr:YqaA family protein [Nitrosococcus oceani]KFI21804.1 membrane protein [Nitrosococcus oceani]